MKIFPVLVLLSLVLAAAVAGNEPARADYRITAIDQHRSRSSTEKVLKYLGLDDKHDTFAIALITGVGDYPQLRGADAVLEPARTDLRLLREGFRELGFDEVVILWNGDFTEENLNAVLREYIDPKLKSATRTRFLHAHTGHGINLAGEGYLLTHRSVSFEDKGNMISLERMRGVLAPTAATAFQSLVLINSCYAGSFVLSYGSDRFLPRNPGAHAITAGGSNELTWGTVRDGSIFFQRVMRGFKGAADIVPQNGDGIVTSFELYTWLKQSIQEETNHRQNPKMGRLSTDEVHGEFFVVVPSRGNGAFDTALDSDAGNWLPFGSNDLLSYRGRLASTRAFTQLTLATSLPTATYEIRGEGGTFNLGLLLDGVNDVVRFENVAFRSAPVIFEFSEDLVVGFVNQRTIPVKIVLSFEVMVRLDSSSKEKHITQDIIGGYRVDPLYTSECNFSCYDIEFYGFYRIVADKETIEGRINTSNVGHGVGADLKMRIAREGLPQLFNILDVRFHGNHNVGISVPMTLVDTKVGGVRIQIEAPSFSFLAAGEQDGAYESMQLPLIQR